MLNSTNILSKLQWQGIVESAHPFLAIGIALCILLWNAGIFEREPNLQELRQNQQLPKEQSAEVEPATKQPSTPRSSQAFKRLNPIQSVERHKLKRLQPAVAGLNAATTPRAKQHFRRLNPNQSVERHRQMLLDLMMEEQHDAKLSNTERIKCD